MKCFLTIRISRDIQEHPSSLASNVKMYYHNKPSVTDQIRFTANNI